MRVAFVNATHRWGGVKTWTLGLATGLASRGHVVDLFLRKGDPFADACRNADLGVQEMSFGPDWNPWAVRLLRREFRERKSQIVITNVSKDNRIAGPAAKRANIPVLMRVGRPGDITDRFKIRFEQRRYVDHMVAPARAISDALERFPWMRTGGRITVIPNGVDLERFRPGDGQGELRGLTRAGDRTPLLATTSQLTPEKGHGVLLEAFAALPPFHPPPHLVLMGQGPEESHLRAQSREFGIESQVHFLGFRSDLHLLLEDVDIAIQSSFTEGLPNTVVEFMAKGKAILATQVDGTPEAIENEVTGLLVPPCDPAALGRGLSRLLADADLRTTLASAARRRAEAEFGQQLMVDRTEDLLRKMIRSHPTG
jgi:glycosyltransferase involved in cell wall biosynthesis